MTDRRRCAERIADRAGRTSAGRPRVRPTPNSGVPSIPHGDRRRGAEGIQIPHRDRAEGTDLDRDWSWPELNQEQERDAQQRGDRVGAEQGALLFVHDLESQGAGERVSAVGKSRVRHGVLQEWVAPS